MASPVADAYTGASGQLVSAGRYASRLSGGITLADAVASGALASAPSVLSGGITLADAVASGAMSGLILPTWRTGQAVGEIRALSGTAIGSASFATASTPKAVDAWGGMALRPDLSQLFSLVGGGHGDSNENLVASLDLRQDAPAWVLRNAATPSGQRVANAAYNSDGKPAARHTYNHQQWSAQRNRFFTVGANSLAGGSATSSNTVDGFNPDTDTWDASGTWPGSSAFGQCIDPATGDIFGFSDWTRYKWTESTQAWSSNASSSGIFMGPPAAFDSTRNKVFAMCHGDGRQSGSGTRIVRFDADLTNKVNITFNASAAYTDWSGLGVGGGCYAGMVYNPTLDVFYWACGTGAGANGTQTIYIITPNNTTVWDMAIMSVSGVTPPAVSANTGLLGRFQYVPAYTGIVFVPTGSGAVHFVRTS